MLATGVGAEEAAWCVEHRTGGAHDELVAQVWGDIAHTAEPVRELLNSRQPCGGGLSAVRQDQAMSRKVWGQLGGESHTDSGRLTMPGVEVMQEASELRVRRVQLE